MVAPMSAGVGIADFAPVAAAAPTSLAYSGSIAGPLAAIGMVATCQIATIPTKISSDSKAARKPSEFLSVATAQLRLMAKLSTYSLGLAGSKALPMTTMVFFDGSGGVSPISFIMLAVSVAR